MFLILLVVILKKKEENTTRKLDEEDIDVEDDEVMSDIMLNVFPPDSENFSDDDPEDLSEVEKNEKGI